jgi:hypothetical protein
MIILFNILSAHAKRIFISFYIIWSLIFVTYLILDDFEWRMLRNV